MFIPLVGQINPLLAANIYLFILTNNQVIGNELTWVWLSTLWALGAL